MKEVLILVKLKNKAGANSTFVEFVSGEKKWNNLMYATENVLYEGEYIKEELASFRTVKELQTGWKAQQRSHQDEKGNRYLEFKRPLRADEVSRMYQFSTDDTINGVPVGIGFVIDSENATEAQRKESRKYAEFSKKLYIAGNSNTMNKYQTQFNPDWVGYAMVFVADEYKDQLKEILDEPVPYHWVDYDRVPVIFDTTMVYRVEVDRLESLVTGSLVTMTEYDPQYINGVNEDFRNHILSEKTYYFDMNNVDMEAVNALKAYIKIELDMDSDKL